MKKLLPALLTLMGAYTASAQVGIGTNNPNPSAQLQIVSADKGVLIPQVQLTSTTDTTTITTGNVQSLLVYNITTNANIKPGYYYWNVNKWYRLLNDEDRDDPAPPAESIIVDNGDGTYTYVNSDGTVTTIDIPGRQTLTYLVYDPATKTLTYTAENGLNTVIDLDAAIKASETLTTLVNNNNGTYTYTNEAGTATVITNTTNASLSIAAGHLVLTDSEGATVSVALSTLGATNATLTINNNGTTTNNQDDTLVLTDNNGVEVSVPLSAINIVTTLVNNNDGTYTYTNEAGTATVITNTTNADLSVAAGNLVLTDSEGATVSVALSALGATNATLTIDNNATPGNSLDDTLVLTDSNGVEVSVPLSAINIVTTLINNNDGTYTYTNEAGTATIITNTTNADLSVAAGNLVLTDSEGATVSVALSSLGATNATLTINNNGTTGNSLDDTLVLTDSNGVEVSVPLSAINIVTTLINNNDGTYTYTNEAGTATVITNTTNANLSVAAGNLVLTDSEGATVSVALSALGATNATLTINNNGTTGNSLDDSLVLTDSNGVEVSVPLSAINIVTTLINNNDGTYTYTNEAGTATVITNTTNADLSVAAGNLVLTDSEGATVSVALSALGATNATLTIDNNATPGNSLDDSLVLTDSNGVEVSVPLSAINIVTTLVNNNDGTYTYTNEAGVTTVIDKNASALPYNNTTSGLTATTVQEGIDELNTKITNQVNSLELKDNFNGTISLVAPDGSDLGTINKADLSYNVATGKYTFTNGNGADVQFGGENLAASDGSIEVTGGVAALLAAAGIKVADSGITTAKLQDGAVTAVKLGADASDVNKVATVNADGTVTYQTVKAENVSIDNTVSGLAATDVQGAIDEIVANTNTQLGNFELAENNDGSFSLIGADGTTVLSTIQKGSLTANVDGTYTFDNNNGTPVTFDPSKVNLSVSNGVYTFTDNAGVSLGTIDVNASALPFSNTVSGLAATDVQGAIDEIVANTNTQLGNFELAENNDGSFSLIGA
ncbi:beta strand repeat-containing protein, partial [Flavobacterium hauense]